MSLSANTLSQESPPLRWLIGSTHTYTCETRSSMRVNQLGMENLIKLVVEVQVLDRPSALGGYVVRVTIQHTEQSQQQGLHQLLAALNQISRVLDIEVDSFGYARRILNQAELQAKWPAVRQALRRQYREFPQTETLLAGLDQQLQTPGALESAILPNGVYGVLFAGLLGRAFSYQPAGEPELRVLPRFFGTIDLPLLVHKYAQPSTGMAAQTVGLAAYNTLDENTFDATSWRRLLRQITDTPTLDATLELASEESYELARIDGALLAANQHLHVAVPGVYLNELTHRLTLQQPAV